MLSLLYYLVFFSGMRDEFRSMPSDKHVVLGETVKLVCQPPRGLPEPRVKWKKDGEVIQPSSRIIVEDEGDIIIHQAQKDDSGSYMCIAYNPAGQRESAFAKLTVLGLYLIVVIIILLF